MPAPIQNATRFGSLHVICRRGEPIRIDVLNDDNSDYFLNNRHRGYVGDFENGTKSMNPVPTDNEDLLTKLAFYFESTKPAIREEHHDLCWRLRKHITPTSPYPPNNVTEVQFNPDKGEAHIIMPRLDQ